MKNKLILTVKGRTNEWTFVVHGDLAYLEEWRKDGLEIYELVGVLPMWMQGTFLERPWMFAQKLWNWIRLY